MLALTNSCKVIQILIDFNLKSLVIPDRIENIIKMQGSLINMKKLGYCRRDEIEREGSEWITFYR